MKRFVISVIAIGVILLIPAIAWTNTTTYTYKVEPEKKAELLKQLIPICACESTGIKTGKPTQFDKDGNVVRGVKNPNDIGECQINIKYNGKKAKEMGLDVFKESDNIKFANWLYQQQGSTPWNWSKPCWQ